VRGYKCNGVIWLGKVFHGKNIRKRLVPKLLSVQIVPCILEVIYWLFLLFVCYESIKMFYRMPKQACHIWFTVHLTSNKTASTARPSEYSKASSKVLYIRLYVTMCICSGNLAGNRGSCYSL